jgi:NTE family protein
MPFGSEGVERGIGLALSGGGFRATLFHLGSLWRLNELGFLGQLERISSVSGGSITAGCLATRWERLDWSDGVIRNFERAVVRPLQRFCSLNLDGPAVRRGAFRPWKRVSDVLEPAYQDNLVGDATLQSLPDRPQFVFNATNFATGMYFRFSKAYAGDPRIGLISQPDFRVSLVLTASAAFPPFLSPVIIRPEPSRFEATEGADLHGIEGYRRRLVLTDGGVFDNLGLQTVWHRFDTILVSDAGAELQADPRPGASWLRQTRRAMGITAHHARDLRKRALLADLRHGVRKGAYWGIRTEIATYGRSDALPVPPAKTHALAAVRTRLNLFTEEEQGELINWGYAVCDAAMRRHVLPDAAPPPAWPFPAFALDR